MILEASSCHVLLPKFWCKHQPKTMMQSLGLVILTKLKNVSEQLRLLVMGGPSLKVITQDYTENYYCPEEVTECHHY